MDTKQITEHFGSIKAAIEALPKSVSRPAFHKWAHNGVPALRQRQYEEATQGKLKADRSVEQ